MKFTFKIPEVEHLPPEQREALLKRCIARPEMQRFRRVFPPFIGLVPGAMGIVFYFTAMLWWRWSFMTTAVVFIGVVAVGFVLMVIAKLRGEVWLLRKLAKSEIELES